NASERLPDEGNAERLAEFLADDQPTVLYFGKLLYNKGVHVLLEALRETDARAVIVGFGDYREELEALAGDRATFTGPLEHRHLVHLLALADATVVPSIFPEAFGMVAAEAAAGPDTLFTGPLEHRHLVHLLALADATVVPSIFPEAFGMVAAESAAAGCPPIVANHSGLAEIAKGLDEDYPPKLGHLASFPSGDVSVLAERLNETLTLGDSNRAALRAAARQAAVELWSWTSVARRILAAAT
ncbi:MAG TPA: glycosyltransferase, partial [Gaiellaceae bacterium]|nr:glycosyltransferase [Gaiellaceae bacterium]